MPSPDLLDPSATSALLSDKTGWGIAGLLLTATITLSKLLLNSLRDQIKDQKETGTLLAAFTATMKEQNAANETRNRVFEESVKMQGLTGVGVTNNGQSLARLETKIENLSGETNDLVRQLASKGRVDP